MRRRLPSSVALAAERLEERVLLSAFTVTNLNNAGTGSLRQAIADANANSGADEIVFQSGLNGTILLSSGEMTITDDLTITGNGVTNTVIDAQSSSRMFGVTGVNTDLTIRDLTLTKGKVTSSAGGGAIISTATGDSTIRVVRCSLDGNKVEGGGTSLYGGAIFSSHSSVVIQDSTLSGNSVDAGDILVEVGPYIYSYILGRAYGGAVASTTGSVTIVGSCLSGNSATSNSFSNGGAIHSGGGLTLINSTVSGNPTAASHNGIHVSGAPVTIVNSTVQTDSLIVVSADLTIHNSIIHEMIFQDFVGQPVLTVRNSLIVNQSELPITNGTTPDANGNIIGGVGNVIDPKLGPLFDNGGRTKTHALLAGSPALNRGNNALAVDPSNGNASILTDARGAPYLRQFGSRVDMGSFEAQPFAISGNTATITGTGAADSFVLRVGPRSVSLGTSTWVLPANITEVQIDGAQGSDTLTFYGTSGQEVLSLSAGTLQLVSSPSGLTGTAISVETISAFGIGGSDQVTLNGTSGSDVLTTSPTNIVFTGTGFNQRLSGFTGVIADGKGGTDRATLNGNNGADVFTTQSNYATMSGATYNVRVNDFDRVTASGRGGTSDQANFNGTSAADTFVATASVASLAVPGYFFQGYDFDVRVANGGGGTDIAKLYGTSANDGFTGFGTFAQLVGAGFTNRALLFEDVRIIGYGGVNRVSLSTTNPIQYVLSRFGTWV